MRHHGGVVTSWTASLLIGLAIASSACSKGGDDAVAPPADTIEILLAGNGDGQVVDNLGDLDCPGDCGPQNYVPGEAVVLMATPEQGSSFGGWSGDCTPDPNEPSWCGVVVDGHMVVTATFTSP